VVVNAKMKAELRHIVLLLTTATLPPPDTTKEVLGLLMCTASRTSDLPPSQHNVHRAASDQGHHCCLQSPLPRAAGAVRDLELDRNPDMTMQQVKINALLRKWVRHASEGTHYSNHPQLLVEGWHLGRTKYRHRLCGSDAARTCR
jgi:hypothetical protein